MKIIVTGSAGFIASHLMDRLGKHQVFAMDKRIGSSTANLDILRNTCQLFKPDMIVHLGANCSSQISLRDPQLDFIDNVAGTFNVCLVAADYNIPVIFNSSMKVYPGEDGIIPPYGRSKLIGEDYLRLFNKLYGVQYIINRPSSVYGPRQEGSEDGGWFTWFIKACINNVPVTLFGDGTQSRDVLYIDDCVDILKDQVDNFEKYANQEFDFGGGIENEVSLNELLNTLDYHKVKYAPKLPGDVQRFVSDNKCMGDWKPKVHWTDGLLKTWDYFA